MFCMKCGAQNANNATYCAKCGAALETQDAAASNLSQMATEPIYVAQPSAAASMPAAEPLAETFQTGPTGYAESPLTEAEQNEMLKQNLKEAKKAYKQARKDAGKSSAPKVVGVVVAMMISAALGAGGMWYYLGQGNSSAASSAASASAAASTSASSSAASSASSAASTDPYAAYIGTWEGKLESTKSRGIWATKSCYGATNFAPEVTIKSIASTGQLTGSFKALFHGHDSNELTTTDVDKHDGDSFVTVDSFTSTFSTKGFDLAGNAGNDKNRMEGTFTVTGSGESLELTLEITSYFEDRATVTDTYTLTKKKA